MNRFADRRIIVLSDGEDSLSKLSAPRFWELLRQERVRLYSIGLGIPFLAIAWWFDRTERARRFLGRHSRTLQRLGGIVMIIAGIGYLTGAWTALFTGLQRILAQTGWPPI